MKHSFIKLMSNSLTYLRKICSVVTKYFPGAVSTLMTSHVFLC